MALGSAEVNETVNYPGKLSGNSLISGSCLPPDGIPQVAEHFRSFCCMHILYRRVKEARERQPGEGRIRWSRGLMVARSDSYDLARHAEVAGIGWLVPPPVDHQYQVSSISVVSDVVTCPPSRLTIRSSVNGKRGVSFFGGSRSDITTGAGRIRRRLNCKPPRSTDTNAIRWPLKLDEFIPRFPRTENAQPAGAG
ncbi:hypothetical protein K0M31_013013 [Melipona bicolor]|uniref:Uncharacterized protein n=1 Tax=Melipona bicolor TaxID=60889 RepID=A0AA40KGV9_9HYME|nr:hypothetical protein K0M31_013013 [Melipona bicolor]